MFSALIHLFLRCSMVSEAAQDELEVLKSIYEDRFNFQEDSTTFIFQCRVTSRVSSICISSYLNVDSNGSPIIEDMEPDPDKFKRSVSRDHYVHTMEVKYLSPVILSCHYSPSYPDSKCIDFSVSCVWMSLSEIEAVQQHLSSKFTVDEPVVFDWITWIEGDMLEFLDIYDEVHLNDIGGYQLSQSVIIANVCHFNSLFFREEFKKEMAECVSCYTEFYGAEMVLLDCDHPFCEECIKLLLSVKLESGDSLQFNCPECDMFIGRDILQRLLTEAEFVRWEKLFIEQSIERDGSVLFCPRCSNHAVKDDVDSTLADCVSCSFIFCDMCDQAWHPGDCSTFFVNKRPREQKTILTQKQKDHIRHKEFNAKSEALKLKYFKRCPNCRSWIQRTYGCNHIHCILCSTDFCYACGKTPRNHLSNCGYCDINVEPEPGWVNPKDDLRPLAANAINEASNQPIIACVRRKSKLQRHANNNHLTCAVCKTEFCFVCRDILKGTKGHFSAVGCPQHGSR